jgi:AraC-like DNA-binding protein
MVAVYENEKISKLLKDFYTVTGQRVGVFDSELNILAEYPKRCCALCDKIRTSKKGFNACMESDRILLEEASTKGVTVRRRCHAGLIDICAPIIDEMGIIGYIMFGQLLYDTNLNQQLDQVRILTKGYIDNPDEVIDSVRVLKDDYLESVENIMTACISYIHLNKMLFATKTGLWAQIDYYIERNYASQFSLKEMADDLGVCISSVCKTVKAHSGKTVHQLLNIKRITKAKKLLTDSNMNVNEAAMTVGIHDYNYFTKLFKKIEGCTPSTYKKKYLNK